MALKFSTTLRNARLNVIETTIGVSPVLYIRSGTVPTGLGSDTGLLLCEIELPVDWMNAAFSGIKSKLGTWEGVGSAAAGTGTVATHFRIKQTTTTHIQGTITEAGGGGDMILDSTEIEEDEAVIVMSFALTDGNG